MAAKKPPQHSQKLSIEEAECTVRCIDAVLRVASTSAAVAASGATGLDTAQWTAITAKAGTTLDVLLSSLVSTPA
jgi:hypothetical protein